MRADDMQFQHTDTLSIVVICTGNIVRSPYAAALLQARCDEHRPGLIHVTSAGTAAREGDPVDPRTLESLARRGIVGPATGSTRVRMDALDTADLVLGAAAEHVRHAMTMSPSTLHRTFTLTGLAAILQHGPPASLLENRAAEPAEATRAAIRWASRHRSLGVGAEDIPDPFRRADEVHAAMVEQVDRAVETIVEGLFGPARRS